MKQEWYDYGDFFAVVLDENWHLWVGRSITLPWPSPALHLVNGRHKMFLAANYSEKTDVQTILGKLDGRVLVYVQGKTWRSDFVGLGSG